MKNSGDIFKEASFVAAKNVFGNNKDPKEDDKGLFAMLGVLLFIGSEAVAVSFRKKFGRNGLNLAMIIGCFVYFGGISAYLFYYLINPDDGFEKGGSENSYLVTGILFSFIAVCVLLKGIFHITGAIKKGDYSDYRGESDLLKFLEKDKWEEKQIRLIAEPLLVLCIGISLCFYNLIGGIALIFCAISVWLREVVEINILGNSVTKKINEPTINNVSNQKSKNRVN